MVGAERRSVAEACARVKTPPASVLVTGASGLLGANAVSVGSQRPRAVTAASRRALSAPEGVRAVGLDIQDETRVSDVLRTLQPAWVLHCAALTDVDACERDPERAHHINARATRSLAEAARDVGARVLYVSTDSVFDGQRGGYEESDPPSPINEYARSKLAGEEAVLAVSASNLVVRTNLYGWNAQPKKSLAEWVLGRLESGLEVPGFTDVVFAPLEASTLSGLLFDMMDRNLSGLYHLGSANAVTKYAFAQLVADAFGFDLNHVLGASVADVSFAAPRPRNTSLDSARCANALGRSLPTVAEGVRTMRDLQDAGWRATLKATVQP